ncbi:MAG: hypothetical protein ACYSSI_09705 [Planctomycetota bacterium]|jgi:hypothetical protein
MTKKNNALVFAVVLVMSIIFIIRIFLCLNNSHRIVISKFDSKNSVKTVEYGSRDFNLIVTSSAKSESLFNRSLKLAVKLIPGSYNFLACGQGLIDKKFDWENRPADLNWDDIIGISYKVYVEPVKGALGKVSMVNIATDVIDGDGEMLRTVKHIHTGEWIEERVYFKELTTRYDYQRDWKSVKWKGTGDDKISLSQVDNGIKSYQFEVMGIVSDKPIDLTANQIEVVLYIDEVALILI